MNSSLRTLCLMALLIVFSFTTMGINVSASETVSDSKQALAKTILADKSLEDVLKRAKEVIATGFSAGAGYGEVWIRDFNTFIELSCDVSDRKQVRDNLLMFFRLQGDDGNIIDGFIPAKDASVGYKFIRKESVPGFWGHKNTVETDQETSLIQAVRKYITCTQEKAFLKEVIDGETVLRRLEMAMEFLLAHRFDEKHGLLWGATTADWGDVQPEHSWGVELDDNSHLTLDIYDNAMFVMAMKNYISLLDNQPEQTEKWTAILSRTQKNIRKHLWDKKRSKYIPHVYLDDSPFPKDFDEDEIYYHGGTATAVQAGLLSNVEIAHALDRMVDNVKKANAASIGLTLYPVYPEGFYKNKGMGPHSYQNGGDWTWFGGRMIIALVENGFYEEAYRELKPMTDRVIKNDGFFEWYSVDNQPRGSGTYRGSAGVLAKSIQLLKAWADNQLK